MDRETDIIKGIRIDLIWWDHHHTLDLFFKLRDGASRDRFVGRSIGLSVCLSVENFDNF